MARRLASEEGLFKGISSGCNVAAAIKVAREYPKAKVIVTIFPDHGYRYFSSELCGVEASVEVPKKDLKVVISYPLRTSLALAVMRWWSAGV